MGAVQRHPHSLFAWFFGLVRFDDSNRPVGACAEPGRTGTALRLTAHAVTAADSMRARRARSALDQAAGPVQSASSSYSPGFIVKTIVLHPRNQAPVSPAATDPRKRQESQIWRYAPGGDDAL